MIVVDDGLATGATMRAAVRSVRAQGPARLVVAVPVGPRQACAALRELVAIDPDHLPQALATIEHVRRAYPAAPQVACFDTAFHRQMPRVARMYALPRRTEEAGILRYGFHGLSYEYIVHALRELDGAASGQVVVAHLGSGASMAARLGGLDTLVFTAGIGEHSPPVRARICAGLEFLGMRLDPRRNEANAAVISRDGSAVTVRVIPTNEDLMIARHTERVVRQIGAGRTYPCPVHLMAVRAASAVIRRAGSRPRAPSH